MTDTKLKLRLNGYGADNDGRLVCYRTPEFRYKHEQLAVIQISNDASGFGAKVIAALDEPSALVGVGCPSALVLFRTAARDVAAHQHFIFEGKQGLLVATVQSPALDVGDFDWRNDRSPLNVPRSALPPLFDDHIEAALAAVKEFGGTLGFLPTAEEIAAEAAREKRLAKYAEEIAAGLHTPEKIAEREDDALVAAHEGQDIHEYDGNFAALVLAARRRVALRRQAKEAAAA